MSKTLHCYLTRFKRWKSFRRRKRSVPYHAHPLLWSSFWRRKHFYFSLLRSTTPHSLCINDVWMFHELNIYSHAFKKCLKIASSYGNISNLFYLSAFLCVCLFVRLSFCLSVLPTVCLNMSEWVLACVYKYLIPVCEHIPVYENVNVFCFHVHSCACLWYSPWLSTDAHVHVFFCEHLLNFYWSALVICIDQHRAVNNQDSPPPNTEQHDARSRF